MTPAANGKPLEAPREQKSWCPFPTESLPEPLRSFVREAARAIGCDASFIALPSLAVVAGCIGNSRRVRLKRGWIEPAVLWCMTIGESGSLKSPAYKLVLCRLRELQRHAVDEHKKAMEQSEIDVCRHEVNVKEWKDKKCPGEAPIPPSRPILRRFTVSDITIEALAPILLMNPRGVLLARDELAGWIGAFDRYAGGKGSDAPNWLSMHDADAVTVDRKTGEPRTIFVPAAAVSVTGTIQPGTLARVVTAENRENGLLARFLLAMPPGKVAVWTDAEIGEDVERRFANMIDNVLSLAPTVNEEGVQEPAMIDLNAEAKATFIDWHNEHARQAAEQTGDLAAAFAKLKGACARLALVFHCCRLADGDSSLADASMIDRESVLSAIIVTDWFKAEAIRIYTGMGEGEEGRRRRDLLSWIEQNSGAVTARDLTHGKRRFKNDPDGAKRALDELVSLGLGRWQQVQGEKGGRPTEQFVLGSGVPVSETPENPVEDGSNGDGDGVETADGWCEEGEI